MEVYMFKYPFFPEHFSFILAQMFWESVEVCTRNDSSKIKGFNHTTGERKIVILNSTNGTQYCDSITTENRTNLFQITMRKENITNLCDEE